MECEVRPATADEIEVYLGKFASVVATAQVALAGGAVRAIGGLANEAETGRVWGFLNVKDGAERFGVRVVRALLRGLKDWNGTVFVQCDELPSAERLLNVLGFKPTDETRLDAERGEPKVLRVWTWQN